MKRFITFLKEFIINEPPRGRRPDREFDDNIEKVIKFMDTVSFNHQTVEGHEIGFKSALDAARLLHLNVTKHERAQEHIHNNEVPNPEANENYFKSSIRTHDHALLKLQDSYTSKTRCCCSRISLDGHSSNYEEALRSFQHGIP